MSQRINHERRNRRQEGRRSETSLARTVYEDGGSLANRTQNHEDIRWLRGMLEAYSDLLTENTKEKIEASIAWLSEVPSRTLGGATEGWRGYYDRLEQAMHIKRKTGEQNDLEPEQRHQYLRQKLKQRVLRKYAREERKAARPDWMDDPSKLPKAPPGRE